MTKYECKRKTLVSLVISVLVLLVSAFSTWPRVYSEELRLFSSGFETGVTLNSPSKSGGQWWQYIAGSDDGYAWTTDLPEDSSSMFQYVVDSGYTLSNYVETKIETVTGHSGGSTKALYMCVKNDAYSSGLTRNQYNLHWDNSYSQAYISYWLKLQDNLYDVMVGGWRNVIEWRESGDDYRVKLGIIKSGTNLLWKVDSQWGRHGYSQEHWKHYSSTPNPKSCAGKWIHIEVFWKHSTGSDGRFWVSIDDTVICDHYGRNKKNSGWSDIYIFKVYASDKSYDAGDCYQWIDDFEIWTDFPPSGVTVDAILNILDIATVAKAYGAKPGDPNWNEIVDVAEPYGEINIYDVVFVVMAMTIE